MLNFKIKKESFLNCLFIVQGASERKGTLPILSNLLIENIGKDSIKISATDLEISIITYCKAEVTSEGKVAVNSKKTYGVVKEFPESKTEDGIFISFKENDSGIITISYKKTVFKLTTVPAIDYPTIVDFKSEDNFNIDFKILKKLINNVIFSTAANEETKRNLTGVYFVLVNLNGKDYLRLVATDGHRLALAQAEIIYSSKTNEGIYDLLKNGVIIPKKVLAEILKLDKSDSVNISINSNNIFFNFTGKFTAPLTASGLSKPLKDLDSEDIPVRGTELISRLIEGKFPDYQTVIPKDNYKTSIINTKNFFNSIKRVSLLAEEKSHSIELSFSDNNLLIKTVNTSVGEASDELDIKYSGEPISIKLNSRYIMDFILNIMEENIQVKFNTIYTPFVIEPFTDNKKGEGKIMEIIGVFMPMRY
ncbi:MAG: DNA polymerase III subunit beta [Deltaproteobacteria bacterium]|nr:DNA polymerase III subunit beta [Deltaproteobacteria bacterium]MCL5891622.1 DNA polymerase III subunit beta [Deltaproteobacteria bacterium]